MYKKELLLEKRHHDQIASFYNERSVHDYTWEVPEELFLFKKNIFVPGCRIIDMGCGPSVSVVRILGTEGLNSITYFGVDISKKLLGFAKKNIPNGHFINADMTTIKIPNNKFDVLLSLGALHHAKNKSTTFTRWLRFVKNGGYLLLREPFFEFLKRGEGESPIEEGIKLNKLLAIIRQHKIRIIKLTLFNTNAFHFFNKVMGKIGLGGWRKYRIFWYPVAIIDSMFAKLARWNNFFHPQAFTMILQKP